MRRSIEGSGISLAGIRFISRGQSGLAIARFGSQDEMADQPHTLPDEPVDLRDKGDADRTASCNSGLAGSSDLRVYERGELRFEERDNVDVRVVSFAGVLRAVFRRLRKERAVVIITSYRPAFAWVPTRMDCGRWIWLRQYQSINGGRRKRLYESKQEAASAAAGRA